MISAHRPRHPSHNNIKNYKEPERKMNTLYERLPELKALTGKKARLKKEDAESIRRENHKETVTTVMKVVNLSKFLDSRAPMVNEEERKLPRATRTRLAQLRSRYSPSLNSYMARIEENVSSNCPNCKVEEHTMHHWFVRLRHLKHLWRGHQTKHCLKQQQSRHIRGFTSVLRQQN